MKKFCIIPSVLVLAFLVAFIASPKKEFSENENRYLQALPKFTFEGFKNGTYIDGVNDYISDHFPLRDGFMGFNTLFNRYALGKSDINGIYFCDDGYFIEEYEKPENTAEISEKLNNFCEKVTSADVYLCLVPTAVTVYEDKLPAFAASSSQGSQLETLEKFYSSSKAVCVDVYKSLSENKDKKLYYKLDHHWTTYGAYLGYAEIAAAMGLSL